MTVLEYRNRLLAVSLVVLTVITVLYYIYARWEQNPADETVFRVPDLLAVDKVLLESKGSTVEVSFDGVRWNANGELADRNMIDVLFATLEQVKPLRPVASALKDSVTNHLQQNGVSVSLFDGDVPLLSFVAGGNSRKTQAWFYKPGDRSYVMTIPGYRVYASGIFELDALGWKDKRAFQINWRNFTTLKATFPKNPSSDFEVKLVKDYFSIEGISSVDTTKLNDFLDAVSYLTVIEYGNSASTLDSLLKSAPEMVIQVNDVTRKEHILALYPTGTEEGRIAGVINGKYLGIFDRNTVEGVLRNRAYFITSSR